MEADLLELLAQTFADLAVFLEDERGLPNTVWGA
jgi:hypothetical protein